MKKVMVFVLAILMANPLMAFDLSKCRTFEFKNNPKLQNGYAQRKVVDKFEIQKQKINIDFVVDNDVIVRGVAVPVTDFGFDFYYKVESRVSEDDIAQKVTDSLERTVLSEHTVLLQKIIDLLEKLNNRPGPGPIDPGPGPVDPGPVTPPVQDIPLAVQKIFESRCAVCHTSTSPKKGWDFQKFEHHKKPFDANDAWTIFDVTDTTEMPLNSSPLTQEEVDAIRSWAKSLTS